MTILRLAALAAGWTLSLGLALLLLGWRLVPIDGQAAAGVVGSGMVVCGALAVGVGVAVLARRLLRPFRELAVAVATPQPARLEALARSPVEEVATLAAAVERAQSKLSYRLADVQRDRADMAAIFEHMADGVLVLDEDDRVELTNPAAARLLGREWLKGPRSPSRAVLRDRVGSREGRTLPEAVRDVVQECRFSDARPRRHTASGPDADAGAGLPDSHRTARSRRSARTGGQIARRQSAAPRTTA